jgi:hypothetical protein
MPTPTTVNLSATAALTERGHLAVQLFRVRDAIRQLSSADRARAAESLPMLLRDCRAASVTGASQSSQDMHLDA